MLRVARQMLLVDCLLNERLNIRGVLAVTSGCLYYRQLGLRIC